MRMSWTIEELVEELNRIERRKHLEKWATEPDVVHLVPGRKYDKIDIGTSGAWMVEKATGEIFNIKAYGVPDLNKKAKANIGSLGWVDPENMHNRRYNDLR